VAVVREKTPSHCAFEPAEVLAAWQALRDWVDGNPQPTALDIQGTCESLIGLVGGKCRFAPGYKVGEFDRRIRPRDP
jgi:hypothetical protein